MFDISWGQSMSISLTAAKQTSLTSSGVNELHNVNSLGTKLLTFFAVIDSR